MEVSLLRGSSNIIEKPNLLSNSSPSSIIPKSGELILADQESDKCKHFTIRGFVSEVRKRNAKICWPFSMPNHTLDEHVDALPPLHVKRFRRWGCQSCLHETIAREPFIENAAHMTNQNDGVNNKRILLLGDATKGSHHETTKLLVTFPQQSKGNNLEGIVIQEGNSNCIRNDGWCPLLCSSKQRDASPTSGSIKAGIKVTKGIYSRLKKNQNLRSKPNAVTAEEEAYPTGEKGEESIMVRANTSEISLLSEDTPKSFSSEWDRTALVHQTSGSGTPDQILRSLNFTIAVSDEEQDKGLRNTGKRKESDCHVPEYRMSLGADVTIPRDGGLPASLIHMSQHDLKDIDECGNEASDTSIPLIRNLLPSQDDARKLVSVEKSHQRKSRKMRTLDDIMKSEELQNDKTNCISSDNAGASGSNETPDQSRRKDEKPNHGCHLIQNTEATAIKRKNRKEAITKDGEGSYLIHWLKKTPKKSSSHKGEGETRCINTATSTPKFATVKVMDLNLEHSGWGDNKQEIVGEKKRNMKPKVEVMKSSFMPQEDNTAQKGLIITKDLKTKNLHPKSAGIVISENIVHHKIETHDNIQKEAPLSNKKNKRHLVEDGTSVKSSQRRSKDSLGVQKQVIFQVHREAKKKRKTMGMSEQEAVDDIPMDIVELLAKKQQERHITNTKHDSVNMTKLSETTRSVKDGTQWDSTTGYHGSEISDATTRCLYQEEPQGDIKRYGAGSSVRINGDAEYRSEAYHSCSRGKQYHHFDLNQEAPLCTPAELQVPSPYIGLSVSGAQLSIVDSNRNHSSQNLSTNGMKMLAFCSDHMDQTISTQNLFSNVHDGSSGLLNGYTPHFYEQKVRSDFNSNTIGLGVNLKTGAHNAAHRTMVHPSEDNAESSASEGNLEAKYFAELGNTYYSNMTQPGDLHNNETVSALNLLRLMQHSACSGGSFHSSRHDNMVYVQAFNGHGGELLGSQVDVKAPSVASGNYELDKQAGNLCKPLRPLPRVGILGPLLQKEISNTSYNSTTSLGFGGRNLSELTFCKTSFTDRQSNELTSQKTIGRWQAEASPLAPVMNVMNAQSSIFQYEASKRIGPSIVPRANTGCSVAKNSIGQVLAGSRDGAFQPVRSTSKMEECTINRNPADFAMPDEDSEYMIGYQETKTKGMPHSGSSQSRPHLPGQKHKMRKLNDLNHSRTSNKSSLDRLSCPRKGT